MTANVKQVMKKLILVFVILMLGCTEHYDFNNEKPILTPGVKDVTISEQITAQAVKKITKPEPVEIPEFVVLKVRKFEYIPTELHLKQGQKIKFITEDVMHGITIPYLNIVESAVPYREKIIEINEPGEYLFYNHIKSGRFWESMKGKIIIT